VGLSAPQAADEIGRISGYRVLKLLGAGAVGVVYLAEDIHLRRLVALKLMQGADAYDETARQRFLREGQSAASLEHENIVSVYQVGEADGTPFLAMQYLQGETLDDRLKREGQIPVVEVVRIAREITAGLAAAHDRGLVHRDIKPANIWLESGKGRVKILDFGLARAATDDTHLTRTGMVVGTPAYMSPEQARGARVDQKSDLYSLGCVIYAMCAGVPPLSAEDTMSMLVALATDSPRPLTAHNPNVPPPLVGLVNRLLIKHPDARVGSAHEVLLALETIERILPRLMHQMTPQGWADPTATGGSGSGFMQVVLGSLLLTGALAIGAYFVAPAQFARVASQIKSLGQGR
jgi:serine/threonine protein kinase